MTLRNPVAAFFDFDETLIEVESGRLGIQWLRNRRQLPSGYIIKILLATFFYQCRLLSDERMVKILLTFYRNKRLVDFQKGARDFYQAYLKPHLAPAIVARVKAHKAKGHVLVLISGSVRYLLEPVVADLGFDHLLCTDLQVNSDGQMTGKADGLVCVDRNKRKLMLELAQKIGLDLEKSYAYGNHPSDLPLLESVGYPHAVSPNRILEKIARQRSWPILGYR
ncbi:MAG: HAD family hydrolase [Desulfobacterales bacterium]|jgi:HAD superfamily hydrolase (TIGR01490 family)